MFIAVDILSQTRYLVWLEAMRKILPRYYRTRRLIRMGFGVLFQLCLMITMIDSNNVKAESTRKTLVIASFDQTISKVLHDALFTSFMQTHPIQIKDFLTTVNLATINDAFRSGSGSPQWQIGLMETSSIQIGCQKGYFVPLSFDLSHIEIFNTKSHDDSTRRCDVPAFRLNIVLAWDKSDIKEPLFWDDFWDVARRPGKRALRLDPRVTLEIALLADHVPPSMIYNTLATKEGLDRAFAKLTQLQPYIVWWKSAADALAIVTKHHVLMAALPASIISEINQGNRQVFGVQWEQYLTDEISWGIVAQNRNSLPAPDAFSAELEFLRYVKSPKRESLFHQTLNEIIQTYNPKTAENQPTILPIPEPYLKNDVLFINTGFWRNHYSTINRRFQKWIEINKNDG